MSKDHDVKKEAKKSPAHSLKEKRMLKKQKKMGAAMGGVHSA